MELADSTNVLNTGLARPEAGSELRFITELGRSLLFSVHPKKVADRVAEALQRETKAAVCGIVVKLEHIGLVVTVIDSAGEDVSHLLRKDDFKKWVGILPPQISSRVEDDSSFLLGGSEHNFEYISPIHINGKVSGAVIVGFEDKHQFTNLTGRLIDATTQMTAMSINLTSHYEATMDASINSAKEIHRKFTETVVDALPVSLYVIDRNYRIVAWNRHREIGDQGIARDSVIGRNIFEVLTKYPKKQLMEEFEQTFATGKIERIEQRTTDENDSTKH